MKAEREPVCEQVSEGEVSGAAPWDDPAADLWKGIVVETPEDYRDYKSGLLQEEGVGDDRVAGLQLRDQEQPLPTQ